MIKVRGFAKIFSQIAQRHNEVLSIKSPAGTLFAYINPKQQRVWEVSEYISCNQPWTISLADDAAANQLYQINAIQYLVDLTQTTQGRHGDGASERAIHRLQRAGDLVLRARKRGYETHAFDVDVTEAWYESLRGTDGVGIIRGIVGNIDGTPVDLGGGLRAV